MLDHQIFRMPQPRYSPNQAPSDFGLFCTVKNLREQIQTSDGDDFCEQLYNILNSISVEELERVFPAWIDRVRQGSEGNGDYLT
jgi:hypothetical protein